MITTKSRFADELGVSRARVSQLVAAGLPCRKDGRLDREKALQWVKAYASSHPGGWGIRGRDIAGRASESLAGKSADSTLHRKRTRVGLLHRAQTGVDLIRDVNEPKVLVTFAQKCLPFGLTPLQAFLVANEHALEVLMALTDVDQDTGCDPSNAQWAAALNVPQSDIDDFYQECERLYRQRDGANA